MVDTKIKTKAAMLHELESIKGLLLEEDDIPILQEVIESQNQSTAEPAPSSTDALFDAALDDLDLDFDDAPVAVETPAAIEPQTKTPRVIVEEQQDFFDSFKSADTHHDTKDDDELLDTIDELEKHTAEVTANKFAGDLGKNIARPSLAKATGENPFLPAHIRSRLHGNNPPPLFAQETARKIASTSVPTRQLGNTSIFSSGVKTHNAQQDLIDSVVEKLMPEIERELRSRLEGMSKHMLDELTK